MTADPRFRGWWPRGHPRMRSFLGVPMLARGEIIGALYLTDKVDAIAFSEADERRIVLLAAHAALAIDNARLHERSRELTIAEERNRLARELHDSVVQQLFGVTLAAESAGSLLARDPDAAAAQLARAQELARGAIEELRSVVAALRPASVEAEGLAGALRKHVEVLRRVTGREIALRDAGAAEAAPALGDDAAAQVFRIAQEALQNALRHAGAERIEVRLEPGPPLVLDRGRRRLRVRPGRGVRALAAARADLDGGAGGGAGRAAGDLLARGRGHHRAAGGAGVIKVLICDDHAVVRQGLRTYLELQEDIEVVGEAADGQAAIDAARRTAPDVILLDLAMPDRDGLGALPQLKDLGRVIVLTSFGEDDRLFAALRGGAVGFLLKDTEPAELVRAIRTAHAGQSPLSPAVAARVIDQLAQAGRPRSIDQLTPREREVLRLIADGLSNKRIARELGVAEKTVKTHVGHVLAKLELTDRTQAALYAVREGLAD